MWWSDPLLGFTWQSAAARTCDLGRLRWSALRRADPRFVRHRFSGRSDRQMTSVGMEVMGSIGVRGLRLVGASVGRAGRVAGLGVGRT